MNPIDRLSDFFSKLPSIGPRQAKRLAFFLVRKDPAFLENFARALGELKSSVKRCLHCYRYFSVGSQQTEQTLCEVCLDENRDSALLLVLEKDLDFEKFHKSSDYQGQYFILGGVIPFLEKEPQKNIRLNELSGEVERRAKSNGLKEVIFALSANPEGENTIEVLKRELEPLTTEYGIKISALGRGLSTGTEIEYSDAETLRNAFKYRH